ncbi:MAG: Rho termination factor N-terminal domain-containing protein, partial [Acidimicrobiia bacterium]|nr:Rho termination factor N-terminal domain-containing protein [Acidimicrobiia bacterium]
MAAEALEQSVLESKDKDQLLAIAKALGVKASARTKKSEIIDQILESTGSVARANGSAAPSGNGDGPVATEPPAEWELAIGGDADE